MIKRQSNLHVGLLILLEFFACTDALLYSCGVPGQTWKKKIKHLAGSAALGTQDPERMGKPWTNLVKLLL